MTVIEATELELEVLAGAAAEGWSYSLEELRVNRRRALAGLEALEGSRQERAGGRPAPPASYGSADPSRTRRGLVEFERLLLVDLQDDAELGWRPVERGVFEGLLERHWDLLMEDRCLQSTAWGFTDLEGGSAAVSVVLDGTGGDRL